MRRKLTSLHNMKVQSLTQSLNPNFETKKIQKMDFSQYKQKLQNLLDRVAIQNKYTNRVSHCNIKNIQQLQLVKKQLQHLLQQKKIQSTNQVLLKNQNNQLSSRLIQNNQKLAIVANQVFQLKRQIKIYKKQLKILKQQNQKYELQIKKYKRQKYQTMIEIYDTQQNKLISTLIEDYVKEVVHPSSLVLYKHCIQTLRNKNFNQFIKGLEVKMNAMEIQNKEYLRIPQAREKNSYSKMNKSNVYERLAFNRKKQSSVLDERKVNSSFKLPAFRIRTENDEECNNNQTVMC